MAFQKNTEIFDAKHILKEELGLNSGDRVADLGCGGVGLFTFQAAAIVSDTGQVHAVDILKDVLANIASRVKMEKVNNISTHWTNLERFGALDINDQSLDAVLLVNVLFQNNDRLTVIKEASRLLKKDGKLLVIEWMPGRGSIGPEPDKKIDPQIVRGLLQQAGLIEHKSFQAGKYHYGLIFKRP